MIIIFTSENELSTLQVAKLLRYYKKEFYIVNPDEDVFKFSRLNQEGIFFYHSVLKKEINFLKVTACWWRRTGLGINNFIKSHKYSEKIVKNKNHNFKELINGKENPLSSEFKDLREYIFQRVFETAEINLGHPKLFGLNRLNILNLANNYGLKAPNYEVVSNANQIPKSKFIGNLFVTKAISNGLYNLVDGKSYYTYTELQSKNAFKGKNINLFPSLLMEVIEKKFEIRSFYIDGKFYSMAIFSQSNEQTEVDFRKYSETKPNKTEPYKLPDEIEIKLDKLFKQIGLNTGSVDLIVDNNNEYVFLEINPVGQYGMTSEPCNYNLDNVIANFLIYGTIS
ncbi:grasp-with-spasm system ATP-grasp peptide maturase [Tenacibaculum tangerinum]|uniref:Grasp-with-spasm system ATP-grasp peptide maturase n=1 Tax=Tenacibaculum tangerinum TaxID=3038772 RepID=A0ABY8L191_9FLAO|nr:grasp-with-spasm system ATP-grasp peptide maturase [Tenacibaculum tangerinum]WGH75233.1 grasp-with-spasm system ATP-grasp peptide maturase [Tenacibaculum tangerinum]